MSPGPIDVQDVKFYAWNASMNPPQDYHERHGDAYANVTVVNALLWWYTLAIGCQGNATRIKESFIHEKSDSICQISIERRLSIRMRAKRSNGPTHWNAQKTYAHLDTSNG